MAQNSWSTLHASCPACSDNTKGYWHHPGGDKCYFVDAIPKKGYIVQMKQQAIRCDGCKAEKDVSQWKFKCNKHNEFLPFIHFKISTQVDKKAAQLDKKVAQLDKNAAQNNNDNDNNVITDDNQDPDNNNDASNIDPNNDDIDNVIKSIDSKFIDKKIVTDIVNKNNESLNETKELIAELDNFNNDDDDDNKDAPVPAEMSAFFTSTKDDLECIAQTQSQLQKTSKILTELLKFKPANVSSKLWDTIDQTTKNTLDDMNMVMNMKNNYVDNLMQIGDIVANKMNNEDDVSMLSDEINKMTKTQEMYKQKIIEATQNALNTLKLLMKENLTQDQLDQINNEISTSQNDNFNQQNKLNKLEVDKSIEINNINEKIKKEKYIQKDMKSKIEDVNEELSDLQQLKKERTEYNKPKINIEPYEGKYVSHIVGGGTVSNNNYGGSSISYNYESHDNDVKWKRYLEWKYEHPSSTLEIEETKLHKKNENFISQNAISVAKMEIEKKSLVKEEKEYEIKINNQKQKVMESKTNFESAMIKLDGFTKKAGVEQSDLKPFLNLTKNVIPTMNEDQKKMNELCTKIQTSYSFVIRGLGPQKNKYEIKRYLEDTNKYFDYLEPYIQVLSYYNYNFMHEIQCKSKVEFNKIHEILGYHNYLASNNFGGYGSYTLKRKIPRPIKRRFRKLCVKNQDWLKYYKDADVAAAHVQTKTKKFFKGFSNVLSKFQTKKAKKKSKQITKFVKKKYLFDTFNKQTGNIQCYFGNNFDKETLKIDTLNVNLVNQIIDVQKKGLKDQNDVYIIVNETILADNTTVQKVIKAIIG